MNPLRILLVEDHSLMADVIARMISRLVEAFPGATITRVKRLEDARLICAKLAPDVTLLDLNLEDALADETVREIAEMSKRTPVVVLTGLEREDLRVAAMAHGASAFILKHDMAKDMNLLERVIVSAIEKFKTAKREGLTQEIEALRKFALTHGPET